VGQLGDALYAIFSPLAAPPPAMPNVVWQHEQVIEAVMAERALLPVRFGTLLPSEAALRELLAVRHARFQADLVRIGRQIEVGLRVLNADETAPAAPPAPLSTSDTSSGRSYMAARLAATRAERERATQAAILAEAIHAPLAALASESVQRTMRTDKLLLSAAYLINPAQLAPFQKRVAQLQAQHPMLRLLGTGPWPPYSFVSAPNADELLREQQV
jgi:hypothetical protein